MGEMQSLNNVLLESTDFPESERLTLQFGSTRTEIETIYRAYQVLLLNSGQNLNCTSSCIRRGGSAATGWPNRGEGWVPM
jgi:hypothetical protein